jgi:hypothetical protein
LGKNPDRPGITNELKISDMSPVDANRVILTGENSVIRLSDNDSGISAASRRSGREYYGNEPK